METRELSALNLITPPLLDHDGVARSWATATAQGSLNCQGPELRQPNVWMKDPSARNTWVRWLPVSATTIQLQLKLGNAGALKMLCSMSESNSNLEGEVVYIRAIVGR